MIIQVEIFFKPVYSDDHIQLFINSTDYEVQANSLSYAFEKLKLSYPHKRIVWFRKECLDLHDFSKEDSESIFKLLHGSFFKHYNYVVKTSSLLTYS